MSSLALGQAVEHVGQLGCDLGVERGETLPELRSSDGGDTDLGEEDAAVAVGRQLEEEEVQAAGERVLGIEDPELRPQRLGQVVHDLIDGRDQEVFLRDEIVVHEPRRQPRFGRDALDRRAGDAMLHDRGAESFDDLTPAWTGETGASHR